MESGADSAEETVIAVNAARSRARDHLAEFHLGPGLVLVGAFLMAWGALGSLLDLYTFLWVGLVLTGAFAAAALTLREFQVRRLGLRGQRAWRRQVTMAILVAGGLQLIAISVLWGHHRSFPWILVSPAFTSAAIYFGVAWAVRSWYVAGLALLAGSAVLAATWVAGAPGGGAGTLVLGAAFTGVGLLRLRAWRPSTR